MNESLARRRVEPGSCRILTLLFCLCLVLAGSRGAEGGSVFMKNGYIIQGPIVERGDGSVILGWPYGKVTIHKRFIDSVVFDQGEEKRLKEDEQQQQQANTDLEENLTLLEGPNEVEELPQDLDLLMKKYVITSKAARGGEEGGDSAVDPAPPVDPSAGVTPETEPGSGVQTQAVKLPRPEDLLGESIKDEQFGITLRPPKGWAVGRKGAAFAVTGAADLDGFRPSINVVAVARGGLSEEECVKLLKEEDARSVEGFEVVSEGPRDLGSRKAYEIVGRGSDNGKQATFRQVLLVAGEQLWVVSAFASSTGDDTVLALIDEALKTVELSAKQ